MKLRHCDLCNEAAATVFCPSDDAFLCWSCDAKVHQANFLVARHVRHSVDSNCSDLTGPGLSGPTCPSCSPESDGGYSSDCVSSTNSLASKEYPKDGGNSIRQCSGYPSTKRLRRGGGSRRVDFYLKAEGIFVGWCGKLGVGADVAVRMACKRMRVCSETSTVLPFRVCLAASMWLGLMLDGSDRSLAMWKVLKRLEVISGVPAKVIVAAALELERRLRGGIRGRLELEEGWAEC